jgi:hypothetical protein
VVNQRNVARNSKGFIMAGSLLPEPKQQFLNDIGDPLFAGQIFTYAAGTLTPKATYQDQALTIANTNPVVANARGEVVMYGSGNYRVILKDLSGNTIYDRDNIETSDVVSSSLLASLASSSGSSLIGYLLAAGLYPQTVQERLRDEVDLMSFIPEAERAAIIDNTSTYDASDRIIAAINFVNLLPFGTELVAPRGTFLCSKPIPWKNKVTLRGKSKVATVFRFTHTGHGFVSANTINSSTAAYIGIAKATIECINPSNTGGGFYDTASSYVDLEKVKVKGFGYGIIFDQTEHAHIDTCELAFNITAGLWLVNGPTLTPGVSPGFTNLIQVTKSQFNATGIGVIDDGGGNHSFIGSNFNGGTRAFRFAAAGNVRIASCSAEYSVDELIWFANLKSDGTAAAATGSVMLDTVGLIMSSDKSCILIDDANTMTICNSYFETQATGTIKTAVTGVCANLTTYGNKWSYYSGLIDNIANRNTQLDANSSAVHSVSQFYAPVSSTLPLETYVPASTGGGTSLGGIALSANNAASAKVQYAAVRPAATSTTAGAESGAINIDLKSAGATVQSYSLRTDSFRPGDDNIKVLGGTAFRWSVVYAGTGTINTSDEREKQQISDIPEAAIRAVRKVKFKQLKFSDAVALKGGEARWHFGVIAQQVKEAFESEGLNAFAYGLLCYDEWPEVHEVTDDDGKIVVPYSPAGNRYGVRYDELLCLKMASFE